MYKLLGRIKNTGPGLVIAATGLGAGDLIAASVAGANFGTAILWVAVLGTLIKYVMNEGLARWQLVTGSTLLEGWVQRLPKIISLYFFTYLLLWTFIVAGALIAGSGLAANALFPELTVMQWGIIHSITAFLLVITGRYALLENIMKLFIGAMFLVVIVCGVLVAPSSAEIFKGLFLPSIPDGSVLFIFGVIGGIGGSVTLLCYGYWIREKGWNQASDLALMRTDLKVAYLLTGLFGIAIMIIAAGVDTDIMNGTDLILAIANELENAVGHTGKLLFLIGFWCAIFSSMLGVWQGIPYLFADFVQQYANRPEAPSMVNTRSTPYRGYLMYIAFPPMLLLLAGKPVWLIIIYAISGAFFMPVLAGLLLYMNNRKIWLGKYRNSATTNLLLILSVMIFIILLARKIMPGSF